MNKYLNDLLIKRSALLALALLLSLAFNVRPVFAQDADGDSIVDTIDLDDDNDGILDADEMASPEVTTWLNQSGGITASGNQLTFHSSAPSGWNSTITSEDLSARGISDTYTLSFTPDQGTIRYAMIGLNQAGQESGGDPAWNQIDHCVYLRNDGALKIYESGSTKLTTVYNAGDLLEIEVIGSVLHYKKNGDVLRTVSITAGQDFYIDTAFPGGATEDYTVSNFQVSSGASSSRDTDGDGIEDHLDTDSDGDHVSDLIESGQDSGVVDSDNDGRHDGSVDSFGVPVAAGGGIVPVDTDDDLRPDTLDLDSDNDGVLDADESINPGVFRWHSQLGGVTAAGNTLSFNDDAVHGSWNSTIHSSDFNQLGITGGFEFSFVVDQEPVWACMIGLNHSGNNSTASYTDIDHAIYLNGTTVRVFENGANQGNFGAFAAGDRFSIAVEGGSLKYKKNGEVFLSRAVVQGTVYYIDNSFLDNGNHVDYTLSDVQVRSYTGLLDSDGDGIADRLDIDSDGDGITDLAESGQNAAVADTNLDGRNDGATNANGVPVTVSGGQVPVDTDGDLVADILDHDSDNDGILDVVEAPVNPDVLAWKDIVGNIAPVGNNLRLNFEDAPSGWSSTIHSEDFTTLGLSGDFEFSFTAPKFPANLFMIGVNASGNDSTISYTDIDHTIYLNGSTYRVFENGTQLVNLGAWLAGDRFSIARVDDEIRYKRNGSVVYTSSGVDPSLDMYIDTSMHHTGADVHLIADIEVSGEIVRPRDSDADGYADYIDTDSDADTISDLIESGQDWEVVDVNEDGVHDGGVDANGIPLAAAGGVPPVDTDADGTIDALDSDSDGDGILDLTEGYADPDNDGQPNFQDLDSDGDGHPDATINAEFAMLFYVPVADELARDAFDHYESGNVDDDQYGVVSITATASGTQIYYDHWEDGSYESNIGSPVNIYSVGNPSGTQIWGDLNDANGKPPGFTTDFINFGDVVALENLVPMPRDADDLRFDGGDKFAVTEPVAVTRASWNDEAKALLAGAVEVYDTSGWGTHYSIPLSEGMSHTDQIFQYVALMVMASVDGTVLQIDEDANGSFKTVNLDEGESILIAGNVSAYNDVEAGGQINASHPVQVEMITGSTYSRYQSRWYHITPTEKWSNEYYNPVASVSGSDRNDVFVYNPHTYPIVVKYERLVDGEVAENSYSVNSKSTKKIPINSLLTAQRFFTDDPADTFYAFVAVDAVSSAGTHDWGSALVPHTLLSPVLQIGWGPGRDALSNTDLNGNYNPVWVTAVADTTVYVDYNGDGGPLSNGCGTWDTFVTVARYQSVRIYDPDGDQTRMKLQACDGTPITAAWGQDPATAPGAQPALDVGTTVPPLAVFAATKTVVHAPGGDLNGDGLFNPGDILRYIITITNPAYIPSRQIHVDDVLPAGGSYVPGSTYRNGNVLLPDGPGTTFPLDEGGWDLGVLAGQEIATYHYDVMLSNPWALNQTSVVSVANISDSENNIQPSSSFTGSFTPGMAVTVSTTTPIVCAGDTAFFDVTIENTGDTMLFNTTISSLLVSDCDLNLGDFAGGASVSYACSKTNMLVDLLNTVTASGFAPGNQSFAWEGSALVEMEKLVDITGIAIEDLNANGVQDGGEGTLAGVVIDLVGPSGSFQEITGANGVFEFLQKKKGSYTLTRSNPTPYLSSTALAGTVGASVVSADEISITLVPDDVSADNQFLAYLPSSISGTVYEEVEVNGVLGAGEVPLEGAIVTLTAVGISSQVTTTSNGVYEFNGLEPGTYTINITSPANHASSGASAGTIGSTVDADDQITVILPASSDSEDNDFFTYVLGSISGRVFNETDLINGQFNVGETNLAGATVVLSGSTNTQATTASDGSYIFTGLLLGEYTLTMIPPANHVASGAVPGRLSSGATTVVTTSLVTTVDTYIENGGKSDDNFESSDDLKTKNNDKTALFHFDVTGIPAGAIVTSAALQLRHASNGDSGITVRGLQMLTGWTGSEVTYNSPGAGLNWAGGGAFSAIDYNVAGTALSLDSEGDIISIPVTTAVNNWLSGAANLGLGVDTTIDEEIKWSGLGSTAPYATLVVDYEVGVIQTNGLAISNAVDQISVVLPAGGFTEGNEFYAFELASISGQVFEDGAADGIKEVGATGLLGVTLGLYDRDNNFIRSMSSAADGTYAFTGLDPRDNYRIRYSNVPANFEIPEVNIGDIFTDSDAYLDGFVDDDEDAAVVYAQCDPVVLETNETNEAYEGDLGLLGGHFDVDVFLGSSREFHEHEYDDTHDVTSVNLLAGIDLGDEWAGLMGGLTVPVTLSLTNTHNASGTYSISANGQRYEGNSRYSQFSLEIDDASTITNLVLDFVSLAAVRQTTPGRVDSDDVNRDGAFSVNIHDANGVFLYQFSVYEHFSGDIVPDVVPPQPEENTGVEIQSTLSIINGSFESAVDPNNATTTFGAGPSAFYFDEGYIPGWNTDASDDLIEIWETDFIGINSAHGVQHAEINATQSSALYQDLNTNPGALMTWGFAHRGRAGVDAIRLEIGPPGGPYVSQGTFADDSISWGVHNGTYDVPSGQTVTRFRYVAVSTSQGHISIGNFLDAISFQQCIQVFSGSAGNVDPTLFYLQPGENRDTIDLGMYEVLPQVTVNDQQVLESDGSTKVWVCLDQAGELPVHVDYTTGNGTALDSSDFTATSGTLVFAAYETCMPVTIPITDDTHIEGAENFTVVVSSPQNAVIVDDTGVVTIIDNDVPAFTISGSVLEDDSVSNDNVIGVDDDGIPGVTVELYRDANADQVAQVGEQVTSTTTDSNGDYSFGGQGYGLYWVVETDPVGYVSETDSDGVNDNVIAGLYDSNVADLDFLDDDIPFNEISIRDASTNENAGTITLMVDINRETADAVSFEYVSEDILATDGVDYNGHSGTVNVPGGVTEYALVFTILDDAIDESDETFRVVLSNPLGALITDDTGLATIIDDDDTVSNIDLSGTVYADNDLTDDNVIDIDDTPIGGALISLYTDPNGNGDESDDGALVEQQITGTNGAYAFLTVQAGNYVIIEVDPTGYTSDWDAQGVTNDNIIAGNFTVTTGSLDFLDDDSGCVDTITMFDTYAFDLEGDCAFSGFSLATNQTSVNGQDYYTGEVTSPLGALGAPIMMQRLTEAVLLIDASIDTGGATNLLIQGVLDFTVFKGDPVSGFPGQQAGVLSVTYEDQSTDTFYVYSEQICGTDYNGIDGGVLVLAANNWPNQSQSRAAFEAQGGTPRAFTLLTSVPPLCGGGGGANQ